MASPLPRKNHNLTAVGNVIKRASDSTTAARSGVYIAGHRVDEYIENSCEHFKAELGKNWRALRQNLEAVDNMSPHKKRASAIQVNGIAQFRARRSWRVCDPSNMLGCFSGAPIDVEMRTARQDFGDRNQQVRVVTPTIEELVLNHEGSLRV